MAGSDTTDEHRMLVRAMTLVADDVLAVDLEALDGPPPAWTPGAHIDLVLPGAPVRSYSLCGDPAAPSYRIAVRRETMSRGGSRAVHERLRPGDRVVVRSPRNHFVLEDAAEYLFIAGGIGITPLLPMLRRARETGARWRLLYLGSSRSRMPFLDELEDLDSDGGSIRIAARDEGTRADLDAEIAAAPDAMIYACGPERLLTALTETVPDADQRLRVEYFVAPEVPFEPGGPFRVRLARTGLELEVAGDETLLGVMRGAGIDVLSDCEEGICGSCETKVLTGAVEHRDFVLTAQEKARNDCMMVCVSRAASALVELDA